MTHPHPDALGEAAEKPPNRTESCFTSSTGDCHPLLPFPWPRATCFFLSLLPASPRGVHGRTAEQSFQRLSHGEGGTGP